MTELHPEIKKVLERIIDRSQDTRKKYLDSINDMENSSEIDRNTISCSNMAHVAASSPKNDQLNILMNKKPNIGIVSSYNDMLSAHKPYENYPSLIKSIANQYGATAQMAGGVPAMCDGITQGRVGMELSLMSRDVIAMSTAIALSHGVYDSAICLGICDKIIPGLFIGALSFGYLPVVFMPAGPMSSGLPNEEKANVRKAFAKGEVSREELIKAESKAYHGEGTCTFYGTANSNQIIMEIMGVHIPGAAFVHPNSDLRHAYNVLAVEQAVKINSKGRDVRPIGKIIDERSFVNAIIGLLATGGSTNHTLHLPAMAAAAGIKLLWEDFDDLSKIIPLLSRVYPNGTADINQFHAAGGVSFIIGELLNNGLLDGSAQTIWKENLFDYVFEPTLINSKINWKKSQVKSFDLDILRYVKKPHQNDGGLKMLNGNIGKCVAKISAVKEQFRYIKAKTLVFDDQEEVKKAYEKGKLNRNVIIVVRNQGPKANGMPELHSLTPMLSNVQDLGFKVALLTDGRMSGASGKILAAIHVTPEAIDNGVIGKIEDDDEIEIDANNGKLNILTDISKRKNSLLNDMKKNQSFGRNIFNTLRIHSQGSEEGGGIKLID